MKPLAILGLVLILLGTVALAYQGITYVTRETVVDVGPIQVEATRERTIPLPPIIGGVTVGVGAVLLIMGLRKNA